MKDAQPVQTKEEYQKSLHFFENHLRQGSDCRLEEEYPLAFRPEESKNIFVLREESEIKAGLVSLVREVEVQKGVLAKVLFIGSVVGKTPFQNKGSQAFLLDEVEAVAKHENIDLISVWSNQIKFYEDRGFLLSGLQASWSSTYSNSLTDKKFDVTVVRSVDSAPTKKHFEAFQSKVCKVSRSFDEFQKLWKIPCMQVAFTENAYALMGKGEDFKGVCHEWAGPADEVMACIDTFRKVEPSLRVLSPGISHTEDEIRVLDAMDNKLFDSRLEYMALLKPLSPKIKREGLDPENLLYPFFIWGLDSI
jgi:hypothetical protein